jgi:small membrane protein
MNWIQVMLIASIVTLLVHLLRSRRNARTQAWVKVGYVAFVLAGIYAVLRPDDTTVVARWVGVRRGTDLMLYALIIAFSFTTMSTYLRFKDLELRYARLARELALASAQAPEPRLELDGVGVPEIVDRSAHTLVEPHLRAPAQNPFGQADVEA